MLIGPGGAAFAEGFDLGLGLGFADHSRGFDGGWDGQLGYEFTRSEDFHVGMQWHHLNGWNGVDPQRGEDGMEFNANALFVTARPAADYLSWVQFKAGVVSADYKIVDLDPLGAQVTDRSDTGFALGLGLVFGSGQFRFHLLDYEHYRVGGESFNVWGISFLLLADIGR